MTSELPGGPIANTPAVPPRIALLCAVTLEREGLARGLEVAGLQVVAEHGEVEGFLAALGAGPVDVALVDLRVTLVEVSPLIAQVRAHDADLPLLVLSQKGDPDLETVCLEAGASAYLEGTTSNLSELVAVIRSLVPHSQPGLAALSSRQLEVLGFIAAGADNLKIAAHLGIGERTVKAHVSSLLRKLKCSNRTQLALRALQFDVVPRPEV